MIALARFLLFWFAFTTLGCHSSVEEPAPASDVASSGAKGVAVSKTDKTSPDQPDPPPGDLQKKWAGDLSSPVLTMSELAPPVAGSPRPEPLSLSETPSPEVMSIPREEENAGPLLEATASQETSLPGGLSPVEPGSPTLTSIPPSPPRQDGSSTHVNPLRDHTESGGIRPVVVGSSFDTTNAPAPINKLRVGGPTETAPPSAAASTTDPPPASDTLSAEDRPNSKDQPFDPVKENGSIFVDWPKPDLVLVMTGRQNGYVEPCGCAGLDRMQGGLNRRASMLENLVEKRKWPVVAVDLGNQVKGHKRQTELKFQHTTEALLEMNYSAVGLGIDDLQLPAGELAAITSNENSPFVSANIDLLQADSELIEKVQLVERNGIQIGITAVLGDSFRKQLNNKSILTTDPVEAISKAADRLRQCEVRVLLAYADREESAALAKRFPMFNVIVTAAGGSEPPKEPVVIPGTKTYLVEVGEKGMCAVVLGIYRDQNCPVRYQRVPLDSRFPASEKIFRLMSIYQDQLKLEGLEGLRVKPVPSPESETKGNYIGSKKCATCHEASYDVWRKSKHADAWKTLLDAKPPRNHDPECISCHVVGWDPQNYYPFVGGFVSSEKTPELENVGCESCHGPGGAHAKAEEGCDIELQERLQKAMVVTIEESRSHPQKMCYNCHDLDNSPEFDFDKYWPEVAHKEEDEEE